MHTARGHLRLPALAASFIAFLPIPVSGQSITTEPVTPIPVSGPWLMLLLWLTLLLAGMWMLRHGPRQARALVIAGLMASGLWMMQAARAQVVDLQFTSADGETLAIPVNQIVGGGGLEGFHRVDYRNSSAISLRIATIVEPDFDACFPAGLDEPLPAPTASSGTACAVGLTLDPDETCRVDVDAICRALADAAVADITVAPPTLSFVEGGSGAVTITTDADSPVPALNLEAAIPDGSGITVQSTTCGAHLSPGDSCEITFTGPAAESTGVAIAGDNTAAATVTVNVSATPVAELDVSPTSLTFVEGDAGSVTVTNTSVSVTASNVAATIPGGSTISVQSSTCGAALAPAASCVITFTSPTEEADTAVAIAGDNTDTETVTIDVTGPLLADITVAPLSVTFAVGGSGSVTVTTDAGSPVPALNLEATIPGGSGITVQSTTCGASLSPGDSCQITFTGSALASIGVPVAGDNTGTETVTVNVVTAALANLSVTPSTLTFASSGTGSVTVTNISVGAAATNVAAAIPGGSTFSVQSTTCGLLLPPTASCTFTFANPVEEGPTTVSITHDAGARSVTLTTVAAPMIAISGPVQQSRVIAVSGAALSLEVTNDAGSAVSATGITVSNKAAVPNVVVDDSDCLTVAPGASCTLELTSNTPYAPATITIGGSNTANSPQTLIVFSHLGGLVFEESGGAGKIVIDVAQEFTSRWTSALSSTGASSLDDGVANTNTIVVDAACSNDPANCAAQQCRNISADWSLPARNELTAIHSALCSNSATPCNAGGFAASSYWSSTELNPLDASTVIFPSGGTAIDDKLMANPVRCVRPF